MKSFTSVFGTSWLQGRKLLPLLISYTTNFTGDVVDLGCGRSPFRPLFATARHFIRVDRYAVDPEVIVIDDPRALPLESSSVDMVLAARMLGDLPDLPAVMRELARILKPEGKILVYEAISYPQHDLPHDYWRVLPAGLEWAATGAGLSVTRVEYMGGYFTNLALHWNLFFAGNLTRFAVLRPLAGLAVTCGNLIFATLDRILPRPALATDYFACVVKSGAPDPEAVSE
ncbi:class I SAM-dependent methyltransferase [uncultured Rhodoblastus sp.]|uniref:class I SAM-dependent methyltransferase n=1 Tax=uncultured Rhodoblastus sp. TaxID=543037 RepID=UPI0026015F69|nr:class I SAM-dependent methyltransferase [uncultured Rhodoblastus sp.]